MKYQFGADKVGICLMIYGFLHVWSDEWLDQLQLHFFLPHVFGDNFCGSEAETGQHHDRVVCIDHQKHQSWGSFQGVWLTWLAAAGWTPAGYLSVLSHYCSFIKNPSALPRLSPSCWFSLSIFFLFESFLWIMQAIEAEWMHLQRCAQTENTQG